MDEITRAFTGRSRSLFQDDLDENAAALTRGLANRRVIVWGGAGTIGSATIRQLLRFPIARVDVVDISENNLAELMRDIRSGPLARFQGELRSFCVDMGGDAGTKLLLSEGPYDLALNFSAVKHVRAERDVFSLLHMIEVNLERLLAALTTLERVGCSRVFSVSSDKAAYPGSLMGATKRLMERLLCGRSWPWATSASRFANVAFSDGSLPHAFRQRFEKRQPLSGPSDIRRYFYSGEEAGQLCLLASILAPDRHIVVPTMDREADTHLFTEIAEVFLRHMGYAARYYEDAAEARERVQADMAGEHYPCVFLPSDTGGEKDEEEFVMDFERPAPFGPRALLSFPSVGASGAGTVDEFLETVRRLREAPGVPTKSALTEAFARALPELRHVDRARSLDEKM